MPVLPHVPLRPTINRLVEWGASAVYLEASRLEARFQWV